MANILFLSPRLSDAATLSASSAVTSLPVANLQKQDPTKKWRTTGVSAEYVVIDAGSGNTIAANAAALVGHNLTGSATIQVRGATSEANLTAGPAVDTTAVSAWPASGKHTDPLWAHEFSLVTWSNSTGYRWWRIDIADGTNTAGRLDVGRLFLGPKWQPSINFDIEFGIGFVPIDVQEPNGYGQTFTDPRPYAQRQFDLMFGLADQDETHDGAMEIGRLRGLAGDIAVSCDPAETTRFHRWSAQALFKGQHQYRAQPWFNNGKHMWAFPVSLIEKL